MLEIILLSECKCSGLEGIRQASAGLESDFLRRCLRNIYLDDASGTYTSTTLSQSISSLVLTPMMFLSLPFSTNAVTSAAYDTVCLIFLNVCSTFFFPCTSHMNPVSRLYPNSWMSSIGRRPLGRPSSSSSSTDFFLHVASLVKTSAPARWHPLLQNIYPCRAFWVSRGGQTGPPPPKGHGKSWLPAVDSLARRG